MSNLDILEQTKYPTSKAKYVGIEIEFVSNAYEEEIQDLLIKQGLHYNTHLGEDSSIEEAPIISEENKLIIEKLYKQLDVLQNKCNALIFGSLKRDNLTEQIEDLDNQIYELENEDSYYCQGYELRVLCPETELKYTMTKLKKVFEQIEAWTNKSCGLHVHLDMRERNAKECFDRLKNKQTEMFMMVNKSRRRNGFCKKSQAFDSPDRYRAINTAALKKLSTIEIRLHEGTINTTDIVKWCSYLINVCDGKARTKEIQSYVRSKIAKNAS